MKRTLPNFNTIYVVIIYWNLSSNRPIRDQRNENQGRLWVQHFLNLSSNEPIKDQLNQITLISHLCEFS